jgi:hypothetical protein
MPTGTLNQTGNTAPSADTGKTKPHNQTGNVVPQEDSSNGKGASTKSESQGSNKGDSQSETVQGFPFRDVRDYLAELEKRDMLIKVNRLMNKDTEIMPLVRWQFRGLESTQRKGWLFDNVTDSRGRKFDGSIAVSIAGASPEMYALEMGEKSPGEINAKWISAMKNPIKPVTQK